MNKQRHTVIWDAHSQAKEKSFENDDDDDDDHHHHHHDSDPLKMYSQRKELENVRRLKYFCPFRMTIAYIGTLVGLLTKVNMVTKVTFGILGFGYRGNIFVSKAFILTISNIQAITGMVSTVIFNKGNRSTHRSTGNFDKQGTHV